VNLTGYEDQEAWKNELQSRVLGNVDYQHARLQKFMATDGPEAVRRIREFEAANVEACKVVRHAEKETGVASQRLARDKAVADGRLDSIRSRGGSP
jgi:hypothetical protein